MEIISQQGDITLVKADAIVNPANSLGEMGGGVAGAIRRVGGVSIEDEAKSKAPVAIGDAIETAAGTLPFRYVIHAPTMEKPGQSTTSENVRQAALAALQCADSFGVKTLAIPGLGTGTGGLSPETAAEIIVETLRHYETASVRKIILIDQEPAMAQAFRDALLAERS
jgi:O-acetyl-ADP-ribose deacetylase